MSKPKVTITIKIFLTRSIIKLEPIFFGVTPDSGIIEQIHNMSIKIFMVTAAGSKCTVSGSDYTETRTRTFSGRWNTSGIHMGYFFLQQHKVGKLIFYHHKNIFKTSIKRLHRFKLRGKHPHKMQPVVCSQGGVFQYFESIQEFFYARSLSFSRFLNNAHTHAHSHSRKRVWRDARSTEWSFHDLTLSSVHVWIWMRSIWAH